ncbi:uncharacterized protein LOC111378834 [Olea europaea var. sylvestris]|uniref:uncharacterized protein LOC111378834 n=1 Tax=Olea europaea var. sylvestris TaxID=158386 RepID=UPI000C1CEDB0|nr:uncharacterized protein LOC111378834 [Olea europaea var. sylvestris]
MDYIIGLPKVEDFGTIIVVVDCLSKYAPFITALKYILAKEIAQLFFKHLSNTGDCLKTSSVIEILVSLANFGPSCSNFLVQLCKKWVKLLIAAQICFNVQKSSSTNKRHFEVVTGQQPLFPHTVDIEQNLKHRFLEFNVGDLVMVKLPDINVYKPTRGKNSRLALKYIGPLLIVKRIGRVTYRVELPSWCKIHKVLHLSVLKPYFADKEDTSRNEPKCSNDENTKEIKKDLGAFKPLIKPYRALMAPRTLSKQMGENIKDHLEENFDRDDGEVIHDILNLSRVEST